MPRNDKFRGIAHEGVAIERSKHYCEMIIAEVLDMANVRAGTNGTLNGKLYVIVTVTRFPGLVQLDNGTQDPPAGYAL